MGFVTFSVKWFVTESSKAISVTLKVNVKVLRIRKLLSPSPILLIAKSASLGGVIFSGRHSAGTFVGNNQKAIGRRKKKRDENCSPEPCVR